MAGGGEFLGAQDILPLPEGGGGLGEISGAGGAAELVENGGGDRGGAEAAAVLPPAIAEGAQR